MPIFGGAETYPALLHTVSAARPDQVFLYCASERGERDAVTFAELERRSRRVAVAAHNRAEWVEQER